FDALINSEWEWSLRQSPEFASSVGDLRYNDQLTDLSAEAVALRKAHAPESLKALKTIDRSNLDARTQLDYDVLAFDLEPQTAYVRFPTEVLQLDHITGIHTAMAELAQTAPRANVKQAEQFLARLTQAPAQINQAIQLLKRGAAMGVTHPRFLVERLPELI